MPVIPKGYIITDKCCDKTRFYDTFDDFPETGLVSRLYVDRETGIVYVWDGSDYITAPSNTAERPWIKSGNITETSSTNVLSTDNIHHQGKVIIGATELTYPHDNFYDLHVDDDAYVHGMVRNNFSYNNESSLSINVNPLTGLDNRDPKEYRTGSTFATINAAINYVNNLSHSGTCTINISGTTNISPATLGTCTINRGKEVTISANGHYINISGTITVLGKFVTNYGTYTFNPTAYIQLSYSASTYHFVSTFYINSASNRSAFRLINGATCFFDSSSIYYTNNNQSVFAFASSGKVTLSATIFYSQGFTSLKLCLASGNWSYYGENNNIILSTSSFNSISSNNIDVTNIEFIIENKLVRGFSTLPLYSTIPATNTIINGNNLSFLNFSSFDDNASATVPVGTIWATSATNTLLLPQGVLMIKY